MARRKRKQPAGSAVSGTPEEGISAEVEIQDAPAPVWRVVGAAVRGVSHERLDLPCQDAFGFVRLPEGLLLVAVADGAGSAANSEIGAKEAVAEALRLMEEAAATVAPQDCAGWQRLFADAAYSARVSVISLAQCAGESPRSYASTLTMAAAWPEGLAVAQIGDGAVVAEGEDGSFFAVTRLQRGEYANETHFLVEEQALDHLVVNVWEQPVTGFAVMSDGLIRLALKLPGQDPHAPFFAPLFRFLRAAGEEDASAAQLAGFLASERVNARTDDDKALVLAARLDRAVP